MLLDSVFFLRSMMGSRGILVYILMDFVWLLPGRVARIIFSIICLFIALSFLSMMVTI